MRKRAALLLLLPALSACRTSELPQPTLVDFQNDPQILRGQWRGWVALEPGQPKALTLDLEASNLADYSYAVNGTGTLGTQTFTVRGYVFATLNQKFVRPQTSPVPQGVQLRLEAGPQNSSVVCPQVQVVNMQPVWKCVYSQGSTFREFDLKRDTP
ncbi:hypothetical protein [Deinococcus aluminii]|uniref:Lipoprotein n=1 Tax=Deinococcus aluminii TaxID=1656885 RepID=A0ABP9XDE4_9DEIO